MIIWKGIRQYIVAVMPNIENVAVCYASLCPILQCCMNDYDLKLVMRLDNPEYYCMFSTVLVDLWASYKWNAQYFSLRKVVMRCSNGNIVSGKNFVRANVGLLMYYKCVIREKSLSQQWFYIR
jgi:hypothetical protein